MSFEERVIAAIKQVPSGYVTSYGLIASIAGSPRAARVVGQILRWSGARRSLPWQRIINSRGHISIVNMAYPAELQAALLRQEGIIVEKRPTGFWVDMKKFGWLPATTILVNPPPSDKI